MVNNDCHIIRVITIPLTKKTGVIAERSIALLNTCINNEIIQQRPVIEVIRNEQKEFREYEVIRVFKNKVEAKRYAYENNLTDILL